MFSELLALLANFMVNAISTTGYLGVFILMTMESMVLPVPSELVMPFAGYLALEGRFNLLLVVFVGGLGGIVGSLISYAIGYYGGRTAIQKYGKYLLINESDLEFTEKLFKQKGETIIFVCRFIPVIRHLISLPAGIGKMNIKRFIAYTFAGATAWCFILAYAGLKLGEKWQEIRNYSEILSFIVLALLAAGLIYFIYNHVTKRK